MNGERSGKGKEYDEYGNLIYEGEYLNGEKNGKGKEYDLYGNLEFEGNYFKGKRWNGKGKSLFEEIEYKNGKKIVNYNFNQFNQGNPFRNPFGNLFGNIITM